LKTAYSDSRLRKQFDRT